MNNFIKNIIDVEHNEEQNNYTSLNDTTSGRPTIPGLATLTKDSCENLNKQRQQIDQDYTAQLRDLNNIEL